MATPLLSGELFATFKNGGPNKVDWSLSETVGTDTPRLEVLGET